MKRILLVLLVFALIMAMFVGCGSTPSGTTSTATAAPTQTTQAAATTPVPTTAAPTQEPEAEDSEEDPRFNLAAGKYEVDSHGFPTAPFEYQLPICTDPDEIVTLWTTCYSIAYLYTEDIADMPYHSKLREMTGITIEYTIVPSDIRQQNFATLLAADDLSDISHAGLAFYPGTALNAIEEGFFLNIYEYIEYIPNYIYQTVSHSDPDVYDAVFYEDDMIVQFRGILAEPMPSMGYCIREDWLDELGITAESVVTYDDWYDTLNRFKTELGVEWPMGIVEGIEGLQGIFASGFDTAAMYSKTNLPGPLRLLDGKPTYTLTQEDDFKFMELLSKWFTEGLIDPNWASYPNSNAMNPQLTTNVIGVAAFSPSVALQLERETNDPDTKWAALSRPRLYEGQIFKFAQKPDPMTMGASSYTVSAKCNNIPLALTWIDYGYSPSGAIFTSWGEEGVTWEYDNSGTMVLTDFALNHPDGLATAWLLNLYAINALAEPNLLYHLRSYAMPGGERLVAFMSEVWNELEYDGSYDLPRSITLDDEASKIVDTYSSDVHTFMGENYLAFVDGSKPLSEWDSYVSTLYELGLDQCEAAWGQMYQKYLNR